LGILLDTSGSAFTNNLGAAYAPNAIGINPTNQNTTCLTLRNGTTQVTNTTMLMPNGVSSNFTIYLKHANRFYTDSIFGHGYALTSTATSVTAGNPFTVTFYSIYPTINLPYTISGVLSSDLSGASLTGTFTSNYQAITYTVSNTMSALNTFSIQTGTQTLTVTLTNPNPPLLPVVQYLFQNNLTNSGTAGSSNNALFGNVSTISGSASLSSSTPLSGSLSYSTTQTRKGRTYSIYDNTGTTCNYVISKLSNISFSSGMTISAWFYIVSMPSTSLLLQILLGVNYNYSTYNAGTFSLYTGNGTANPAPLYWGGNNGAATIISDLQAVKNTWVHIAQVYSVSGSTTTLNVYVNNVIALSNFTVATSLGSVPFIGSLTTSGLGIFGTDNNWGYNNYKGYLDDFRVYNSALTAAQISNVYNN
jgi:hypothetical protein